MPTLRRAVVALGLLLALSMPANAGSIMVYSISPSPKWDAPQPGQMFQHAMEMSDERQARAIMDDKGAFTGPFGWRINPAVLLGTVTAMMIDIPSWGGALAGALWFRLRPWYWRVFAGVGLAEVFALAAWFVTLRQRAVYGYDPNPSGLALVAYGIAALIWGLIIVGSRAGIGSRFRVQWLDQVLGRRRYLKIGLAGLITWVILYVGYVNVVRPFGGYWSNETWDTFWRWLCIPPVLLAVVAAIIVWALKNGNPRLPSAIGPGVVVPAVGITSELSTTDRLRATVEPLIANSKARGATNPRQAFDMSIGRASSNEEWERHRHTWELLWPYVGPRT